MFRIESVEFRPYPVQFEQFRTSPTQPIGRHLYRIGRKLRRLARKSAPKSKPDVGSPNAGMGRLSRSIDILKYGRGVGNPYIEVGSRVSYALYVHEGTRPHTIVGKRSPERLLRFKHRGKVVYAKKVNHPGTKKNRYLSKHLRESITF